MRWLSPCSPSGQSRPGGFGISDGFKCHQKKNKRHAWMTAFIYNSSIQLILFGIGRGELPRIMAVTLKMHLSLIWVGGKRRLPFKNLCRLPYSASIF